MFVRAGISRLYHDRDYATRTHEFAASMAPEQQVRVAFVDRLVSKYFICLVYFNDVTTRNDHC